MSEERLAYLERVEAAARSYVDLVTEESEGPGHAVARDIRSALTALVDAVRPAPEQSGLDDGVPLEDGGEK